MTVPYRVTAPHPTHIPTQEASDLPAAAWGPGGTTLATAGSRGPASAAPAPAGTRVPFSAYKRALSSGSRQFDTQAAAAAGAADSHGAELLDQVKGDAQLLDSAGDEALMDSKDFF